MNQGNAWRNGMAHSSLRALKESGLAPEGIARSLHEQIVRGTVHHWMTRAS